MRAAPRVPNGRGVAGGAARPARVRRAALLAVLPAAALAAAPAAAGAQPLAERVARAGDAAVRFHYAVRAGVCGDPVRGIAIAGDDGVSYFGDSWRSDDGPRHAALCEAGPARVTLQLRGGVPRAVRLAVGGAAIGRTRADGGVPPSRAVDLGAVSAPEAAAYLLDVAGRSDAPRGDAVLLAAVIADSTVLWPRLLGLARAQHASPDARRDAAFWAGRAACEALTGSRPRPSSADTADRDVRRQVVFAISQQPGDARAATLTRVARTDRDPAVRCAALFWLGQPAGRRPVDARVLDLYEDVLRGR